MASELELEIRQRISEYLHERVALFQLEEWLLALLWDLADSDDEGARALAGRAQNLISETSRGDRDLVSLRKELEEATRPFAPTLEVVARVSVLARQSIISVGLPAKIEPQIALSSSASMEPELRRFYVQSPMVGA